METLQSLNKIKFYAFDSNYKFQRNKSKYWLLMVAEKEGFQTTSLSYIICSNKKIKEINKKYLAHNFATDIITFNLSEDKNNILAEMYIGIETIKENAKELNVKIEEEFLRVVLHGLLHLLGYDDKTASQKAEMRKKEDFYLSQY